MDAKHNLPKRPPTPSEIKIEKQINKIRKIEDIKNQNIILFEKVESKEAEELLKSKQVIFNICTFLAAIITFIVLYFSLYNQSDYSMLIGVPICSAIMVAFIGISIKHSCLKKYYDLLRITRNNDKIRHEEKVKQAERIRLQNLDKIKTTSKNVKKSVKEYNEIFEE